MISFSPDTRPEGAGRRKSIAAVFLLVVLTVLPIQAREAGAATIEIAPVLIEMQGGATTTVAVSNRGTEQTAVQVRGFAWSQEGNEDNLTRTDALVVSPPIFQVPAGATQTVRILLRQPPSATENSYRLIFDEVPPADDNAAVRFALRISIPVFSSPARPLQAKLISRLIVDANGKARLEIRNEGGKRSRVLNPVLTSAGVTLTAEGPPNPYVLPGITRRWTITGSAPRPGQKVNFSAETDGGPIKEDLLVAAGP